MEQSGVDQNHQYTKTTLQNNQKSEQLVIDLESIDTHEVFMGGANEKEAKNNVNKLSTREMDTLKVLCDTLLPAVDPPNSDVDESVRQFYHTSATEVGTHDHLAYLVSQRLQQHVWLIRLLLIILSTSIGTLIMGGTKALSLKYPFINKMTQLPLEKRQRILLSWSTSCFFLYRMAFAGLKLVILFAFFTQLDDKQENMAWKAIDYEGPDPDFNTKTKSKKNKLSSPQVGTEAQKDVNKAQPNLSNIEDNIYGPLHKGILNTNNPKTILLESLRSSGFKASTHSKKSSTLPSITIKCDVVVVGSGSGGGVVAGTLALAGYKVLVLEKGEYYARTNLTLLEGPTLDRMYEGSGMVLTRDFGVAILAGSTVGGGSTINWSASIRTPQHVVREWAQANELELFESPLFKEALDVICERMEVQSDVEDEGFNNSVLRKGCLELGYPLQDIPRNASKDHYCGWCGFGCKDGRKKGTSETWLKDLVDSGNGIILSGCDVTQVLHTTKKGRNRGTAYGVSFNLNGDLCVVEAKATVVACGALNTPPLLKKSGLKNPNIGKNLHLHPVVMAWGHFPETNSSSASSTSEQNTWLSEEKKSYKGGIMTVMSTVVANNDESGYGAVIQTPSLHPGLFSVVTPWISGTDFKHRMTKFSRTAHIFALARDTGSGTVHSSPFDVSYQLSNTDETNLREGVEKMLRILAAAGAEEIGTSHYNGSKLNVKKASYHEFETFVKEESSRPYKSLTATIASAHQMGSCRMGVDPRTSVVNQRGETWEVEGLYVADSSVFPTALGVNPMVTVQAIAYCTSQSVLEYLRRKRKT